MASRATQTQNTQASTPDPNDPAAQWAALGFTIRTRSRNARGARSQRGAASDPKTPAMRISTNGRTFNARLNAQAIAQLPDADHVRVVANPNTREIVVMPTGEQDAERSTLRRGENRKPASFSVTGLMSGLNYPKGATFKRFHLPVELKNGALVSAPVPHHSDLEPVSQAEAQADDEDTSDFDEDETTTNGVGDDDASDIDLDDDAEDVS